MCSDLKNRHSSADIVFLKSENLHVTTFGGALRRDIHDFGVLLDSEWMLVEEGCD